MQLCLLKNAGQLIFFILVGRAGYLTIIVGMAGRAFANKNCPQGQAFDQFFQIPGVARRFTRGMLVAGIDSHIRL